MLNHLNVGDIIKLKDSRTYTIHKVFRTKKSNVYVYGLGFDPIHPGNFEWYHEDGKPITYWTNSPYLKIVNENKSIVEIIRENNGLYI